MSSNVIKCIFKIGKFETKIGQPSEYRVLIGAGFADLPPPATAFAVGTAVEIYREKAQAWVPAVVSSHLPGGEIEGFALLLFLSFKA